MSNKKNKMTPAQVAEQLGKYIQKQEETLKKFPIGPLANSARLNLKKGMEAMAALRQTNDQMRQAKQPQQMQSAPQQMVLGGSPTEDVVVPASKSGFEVGLRQYNPGALESGKGMLDKLPDERFATFPTLEDGWNALIRQLTRYQQGLTPGTSGDMTLAEAMGKYAPKYENDTKGYINKIIEGTGATADTPIKDINVNKWATAISRVESPQAFVALENAGLLDQEAASVYTNDPLVTRARESGAAEKFTSSVPTITADRDTTSYAQLYNQPVPAQAPAATPESVAPAAAQPGSQPAGNTSPLNSSADLSAIPDSMLSPEAQAQKRAASAPSPDPTVGDPNVTQADPTAIGMGYGKTNFNSAKAVSSEQRVPGTNITYAQNEFGDYNVHVPANSGEYKSPTGKILNHGGFDGQYVIRASDWTGPESIQQLVTDKRAIPYSVNVDGPATDGDRSEFFSSPLSDPTNRNIQLDLDAQTLASTMGEYASGMSFDFDDVAELVAKQRGIKPIKQTQQMSPSGNNVYMRNDPEDTERYNEEMAAIRAEIAANPGSYVWKDEDGKEHVGVGGYSPFSDYVAYNTNDPEFQTRYQNRQQTWTLGGQFLMPGGFKPFRATALSRGPQAMGTTLGDESMAALAAGNTDDALRLAAAETPKALPQGQLALPAPKTTAGPAVKGVPGMRFKPGTGAADEVVTYTPANNPAGNQIRLTPTTTAAQRGSMTAGQQIANSGVSVLDDGAGVFTGIPGQGVARPGGLLPVAQRGNVSVFRPAGKPVTDITPYINYNMEQGLARVAGAGDDVLRLAPQVADDWQAMARAARMEQAARSIFGTAVQGAAAYDPQFDPRVLQEGTEGVIPGGDVVDQIPGKPDPVDEGGAKDAVPPTTGEEVGADKSVTPPSDIQPGAADTININMPKANWMMGVPALASLASGQIMNKALQRMEGPTAPITSDIPAFNYDSQIGQQLQDIRQATTAMGQNTGLASGQAGALRQGLLAQRFRQEGAVRAQDASMKQQAKANYDRMAYAARQMDDTLRNKYMEDRTNFNNQMELLRAQVKQQPLEVLSATAQDYLKNVYQPNMANMIEGVGRQFDTGQYLPSMFGGPEN